MLFHNHHIIAIDGTAASGKGTIGRALAKEFAMAWLDTGALYRFVALSARRAGLDFTDEPAVTKLASTLVAGIKTEDLADADVRTDETGIGASIVSAYPGVRKALFDLQRNFAKHPPAFTLGQPAKGAILDGRDIGTVICPDAFMKFFVTARPEIRAERRFKELQARGIATTPDAVLHHMLERDRRDANRDDAPMKPADDALILDTSDWTVDEAIGFAKNCVLDRL
jgi:cytidylate kinase